MAIKTNTKVSIGNQATLVKRRFARGEVELESPAKHLISRFYDCFLCLFKTLNVMIRSSMCHEIWLLQIIQICVQVIDTLVVRHRASNFEYKQNLAEDCVYSMPRKGKDMSLLVSSFVVV